MGLFSRRRETADARPWRVPPFATSDSDLLYQHGITCVSRSDGLGMMSVGWALWGLSGLDQHQAYDLLSDGYRSWSGTEQARDESRRAFVLDVFHRLAEIHPRIPSTADLATVSSSVAQPASVAYGARCWAGSELLELGVTPELEQQVFDAFADTHPAFMPSRTLSQFRALCSTRGLPEPPG